MPELNKISIDRSGELNRIPTNITATEGKKKLLAAGWELIRTGNHQIFKKGDEILTISSTGTLSPWLTQLVYRACAKAIIRKTGKNEPIPLMVKHKSRSWGVIEKKGDYYLLVDLAMGNKLQALTIECVPIKPEDIAPPPPLKEEKPQVEIPLPPPPPPPIVEERREAPKPVVPVASSFQPPRREYFDRPLPREAPKPVVPETRLPADEDFEEWAKQTEHFIYLMGVKAEELLHQAATLEDQQKTFKQMLEVARTLRVGGVPPPPPPAPEPRRTILPPTGPKKRGTRRPNIQDWERERVRVMYFEEGLSQDEIASHLDRGKASISRIVSRLKETGRNRP